MNELKWKPDRKKLRPDALNEHNLIEDNFLSLD